MTTISVGGVIGAGLFVGTGAVMNKTGPARRIGIPGSGDVMNAIVVTAALSCLNSGVCVARACSSRSRAAATRRGLLEVNDRGVPVKAILLSVSVGFVSVIFDAISPDKVFLFLVNSSGAVALFYVLIALAELRPRRRLEAEAPERLKLRMWLFPWLTYAAIAGWWPSSWP